MYSKYPRRFILKFIKKSSSKMYKRAVSLTCSGTNFTHFTVTSLHWTDDLLKESPLNDNYLQENRIETKKSRSKSIKV